MCDDGWFDSESLSLSLKFCHETSWDVACDTCAKMNAMLLEASDMNIFNEPINFTSLWLGASGNCSSPEHCSYIKDVYKKPKQCNDGMMRHRFICKTARRTTTTPTRTISSVASHDTDLSTITLPASTTSLLTESAPTSLTILSVSSPAIPIGITEKTTGETTKDALVIPLAVSFAVLVLVILFIVALLLCRKRKRSKSKSHPNGVSNPAYGELQVQQKSQFPMHGLGVSVTPSAPSYEEIEGLYPRLPVGDQDPFNVPEYGATGPSPTSAPNGSYSLAQSTNGPADTYSRIQKPCVDPNDITLHENTEYAGFEDQNGTDPGDLEIVDNINYGHIQDQQGVRDVSVQKPQSDPDDVTLFDNNTYGNHGNHDEGEGRPSVQRNSYPDELIVHDNLTYGEHGINGNPDAEYSEIKKPISDKDDVVIHDNATYGHTLVGKQY